MYRPARISLLGRTEFTVYRYQLQFWVVIDWASPKTNTSMTVQPTGLAQIARFKTKTGSYPPTITVWHDTTVDNNRHSKKTIHY